MNNSKVTLNSIAEEAGVSVATVSRVMNDNANVSRDVRNRVKKVAKKLEYEKSRRKSKRTGVIGLIVPNVLNPFFPLLIKGIESVCKIHDYNIVFCDSEDSVEGENKSIRKLLDFNVEGLVYVSSEGENQQIIRLLDDGFPVVLLDRLIDSQKICAITADNLEGSYQAVKYLLNIGHRRILHISGPLKLNTARDRFCGYKRALDEAGIYFQEEMVIKGDFDFTKTYEQVKEAVHRRIPFTAIFSSNDSMAFGAFQALKEEGIAVPSTPSQKFCPTYWQLNN